MYIWNDTNHKAILHLKQKPIDPIIDSKNNWTMQYSASHDALTYSNSSYITMVTATDKIFYILKRLKWWCISNFEKYSKSDVIQY